MFRVWVRGYLLDSGRRSRREMSTGARVDNNFRVEKSVVNCDLCRNARFIYVYRSTVLYVVQVLLLAVGTGEVNTCSLSVLFEKRDPSAPALNPKTK